MKRRLFCFFAFCILFLKTPQSGLRPDSFSSGNRHPFVCFADISPHRGITFQGRRVTKELFCLPTWRTDSFRFRKPYPRLRIANCELRIEKPEWHSLATYYYHCACDAIENPFRHDYVVPPPPKVEARAVAPKLHKSSGDRMGSLILKRTANSRP